MSNMPCQSCRTKLLPPFKGRRGDAVLIITGGYHVPGPFGFAFSTWIHMLAPESGNFNGAAMMPYNKAVGCAPVFGLRRARVPRAPHLGS